MGSYTVAGTAIRIGSMIAFASADPEGGGRDDAPSSSIRPIESAEVPHLLRVFMCMRIQDLQQAWLTITDDAGKTCFEGWLTVDDGVEVVITTAQAAPKVRLLLESERWHRQAHVCREGALTEHVFV